MNSSIREWGGRRINLHGETFGRKAVPVGNGGDGDGTLVPDPDPRIPPREAAPSNRSSQGRKAHVRKGPLAPKYIYTQDYVARLIRLMSIT